MHTYARYTAARLINRKRKERERERPRETGEKENNDQKRQRKSEREREICLISVICFHTFCTRSYMRTLILAYIATSFGCTATMLYCTLDFYENVI